MSGLCNSWRRKRRRHALALAWCNDPETAAWLITETSRNITALDSVVLFKRMAQYWLQHYEQSDARLNDECGAQSDSVPGQDSIAWRVREVVAKMPMVQRMILSLVDVARLSYLETAAVMDMSLFDVQYHIVTARGILLDELPSDVVIPGGSGTGEPIKSC